MAKNKGKTKARSMEYIEETVDEFEYRGENILRKVLTELTDGRVEGFMYVRDFSDVKVRWQRSDDEFRLQLPHMLIGLPNSPLKNLIESICMRCYRPLNTEWHAPKELYAYLRVSPCELRTRNRELFLKANNLTEVTDEEADEILLREANANGIDDITLATGPHITECNTKNSAVFRVITVPNDLIDLEKGIIDRTGLMLYLKKRAKKMAENIEALGEMSC